MTSTVGAAIVSSHSQRRPLIWSMGGLSTSRSGGKRQHYLARTTNTAVTTVPTDGAAKARSSDDTPIKLSDLGETYNL